MDDLSLKTLFPSILLTKYNLSAYSLRLLTRWTIWIIVVDSWSAHKAIRNLEGYEENWVWRGGEPALGWAQTTKEPITLGWGLGLSVPISCPHLLCPGAQILPVSLAKSRPLTKSRQIFSPFLAFLCLPTIPPALTGLPHPTSGSSSTPETTLIPSHDSVCSSCHEDAMHT